MTDHTTRASGGHITVPTELAALAAGVAVATIRKWASRGKLTRYGSPRRAEYDLDELYGLMAKDSPWRHASSPEPGVR
jgi:hypothetical protein